MGRACHPSGADTGGELRPALAKRPTHTVLVTWQLPWVGGPCRLGQPARPPVPGKAAVLGGSPVGTSALACLRLPHRHALCLPPDSLGWKLFYVTGCLFVAVQNLEDWEVSPARPQGVART